MQVVRTEFMPAVNVGDSDLKIKLCQPVPNGQKVEASPLVKICHVYESHLQSSKKIFQKIPRQCIHYHSLECIPCYPAVGFPSSLFPTCCIQVASLRSSAPPLG